MIFNLVLNYPNAKPDGDLGFMSMIFNSKTSFNKFEFSPVGVVFARMIYLKNKECKQKKKSSDQIR